MKRIIFSLLSLLLIAFVSIGQQTGQFEETITFNGSSRGLAYSVPSNYVSTSQYSLVVGLHGCGGNELQTRNTLAFLSDSLNAIVICPEGPTTNAGFMGNSGLNEWDILNEAINVVAANYSIDVSNVFLWGFSCNGFAAAQNGMSGVHSFKGIIPFNPALDASYFSQNAVDFNNSTKTCLCAGTADQGYSQMERYRDSLISNGAQHYWNEMQGINHTTAFPTFKDEMLECFNYFDPYLNVYEIEQDNYYSVYPNPFTDGFNVKLSETLVNGANYFDVYVYNVVGELVHTQRSLFSSGTAKIEHDFKEGVYFIQLANSSMRSKRLKVIKK